VNDILNQLGLLRNPCLVFGILGTIMFFDFARELLESEHLETRVLGLVISLAGMILVFVVLIFYIYAYLHLPANVQQFAFLDNIKEAVREDKKVRESGAAREDKVQ
jgi:Na+-transporting methylmalonyl-CoA/oxaloacetate decarboxylase gamma subunit